MGCGNVDDPIGEVVAALRAARRVVVATGAGMSRESGIPTFREAGSGLWARFDPARLASEAGFRAAPATVFGWYAWRRAVAAQAVPHPGYDALVRLERLVPELTVVTQNVDGLHRRAGSARVIELHGALDRFRCLDRGHAAPPELVRLADASGDVEPPACPRCGSPLRPDVVWFGEVLPSTSLSMAWELAARCDLMLVVGTSGMVYPAAALPRIARDAGAQVVEVNPGPTELTSLATFVCTGTAADVLPKLVRVLEAA